MKRLLFIFVLFISVVQSPAQNTVLDSIIFNGVWRNYRLYLPTGFTPSVSRPLVFNFHGYGSNALEQELYSQFDLVADTGNFLVCYPNGLNNSWNIFGGAPDDPGFTDTLITILHSAYNINLNRVYATGLSNGGFFSNLLACQMSDKIAAIAPVAGTNVDAIQNTCNPGRLVPILYIHGTADNVVSYYGSVGFVSAFDLLEMWATLNGCSNIIDTVPVPNISTTDQCTAELISWTGCDSNKQVVHYRILNGGHTWPGAPVNIGVTNQDFNASGVIWNFFNQYSLLNGVHKIETVKLNAYPNPFNTSFSIDLPAGNEYSVQLFSADGKMIQTFESVRDKIEITGKELSAGYYIVKITSALSTTSLQVIHLKE